MCSAEMTKKETFDMQSKNELSNPSQSVRTRLVTSAIP